MFAGQPQRGAAGGQDRQPRAPAQEIGGQRRRVEQMLEVVENQQQVTVAQRIPQAVERRPAACLDQRQDWATVGATRMGSRTAARGTNNAMVEGWAQVSGDPEREGGLANAAGSSKRYEPDIALPE